VSPWSDIFVLPPPASTATFRLPWVGASVGGWGGRGRVAVLAAVLAVSSLLTSAGTAGGPPPRGVTALFFGDSLIAGTGALSRQPVQALTAADRLGWRAVVDARGGTGYTTGGSKGRPYLERLRHDGYLRTAYDVIVLEGGTNDGHHGSLTTLYDAALRTVDFVRSRQPHARIVLVGAFAPPGVSLDRYVVVDQVLAQVALDRGLQYVSQLPYSTTTDSHFLSRDAFHPSDAGYARMGRDLAVALRG
jgi:lysophospholipase L1-like esterase